MTGAVLAVARVDLAVFLVSAAIVLAGAIGVVIARNPVHSTLMLVMTLFGVAVLFIAQQADFLAAVQVIVYAGAIVVLFLFVIMLIGVDREENVQADPLRAQRPLALVLGLVALGEILWLGGSSWTSGARSVAGVANGPGTNVEKLARSIFTRYLLPFEATSVLLVIAVVGAVVLARQPEPGVSEAEPDVAAEPDAAADEDSPADAEEATTP